MTDDLIRPLGSEHEDFLRDESRQNGEAQSISFPANSDNISEIIREIRRTGSTITTQGARTGIVAGAVPQSGHILNLSRMKQIQKPVNTSECYTTMIVQPGALLDEIRETAAEYNLMFPPDPTETTASIGGMVAANASGSMSFLYGATRKWVTALEIILGDGDTLSLTRGKHFANKRHFNLTTNGGRTISSNLPDYTIPHVKSAAGYYIADDMDMIDLFIGMEGTLGIISQIELKLIPKPAAFCGLTVFLPNEESALKLVRILRGESIQDIEPIAFRPAAIEYFNSDALNLLRNAKANYPAFEKIPALKPEYHSAIYTEFHGESDEQLEEIVMLVMEALTELGGSDDNTWFATNARELEPLKAFRHATPEAVNLLIDQRKRSEPKLTKLGTDMSVPDSHLEQIMDIYNKGLSDANLESVIFGHIGNNHLHVNIIPKTMDDYAKGKELYLSWAKKVIEFGGSISAEHGIGKLKAPFLELMYGREAIEQMQSLKKLFDPDNILNPGNLF